MALYDEFIREISTMRFDADDFDIQNHLFTSVYHALVTEKKSIEDEQFSIPESLKTSPEVVRHLIEQQNLQAANLATINKVIADIKQKALALERPIDVTKPLPELTPASIKNFVSCFKNLGHLAFVLSDAPASIKAHQTDMVFHVLFDLKTQAEQESQIRTLSRPEQNDILAQAILAYQSEGKTGDYKIKVKKLIFMLYTEMVFEAANKPNKTLSTKEHTKWLNDLKNQLPANFPQELKTSLSQYKRSDGTTIQHALNRVAKRVNDPALPDTQDYKKNIKAVRRCYQELGVGQKEHEDLLKIWQRNLQADLFAGRSITELALFKNNERMRESLFKLFESSFIEKNKAGNLTKNTINTIQEMAKEKLKLAGQLYRDYFYLSKESDEFKKQALQKLDNDFTFLDSLNNTPDSELKLERREEKSRLNHKLNFELQKLNERLIKINEIKNNLNKELGFDLNEESDDYRRLLFASIVENESNAVAIKQLDRNVSISISSLGVNHSDLESMIQTVRKKKKDDLCKEVVQSEKEIEGKKKLLTDLKRINKTSRTDARIIVINQTITEILSFEKKQQKALKQLKVIDPNYQMSSQEPDINSVSSQPDSIDKLRGEIEKYKASHDIDTYIINGLNSVMTSYEFKLYACSYEGESLIDLRKKIQSEQQQNEVPDQIYDILTRDIMEGMPSLKSLFVEIDKLTDKKTQKKTEIDGAYDIFKKLYPKNTFGVTDPTKNDENRFTQLQNAAATIKGIINPFPEENSNFEVLRERIKQNSKILDQKSAYPYVDNKNLKNKRDYFLKNYKNHFQYVLDDFNIKIDRFIQEKLATVAADPSKEILLYQLLELQLFHDQLADHYLSQYNVTTLQEIQGKEITQAFEMIQSGQFLEALEIKNLSNKVSDVYAAIALLPPTKNPKLATLISKANFISNGASIRKEKTAAVKVALAENNLKKLQEVYQSEYLDPSIIKEFGYGAKVAEASRIKQNIQEMAVHYVNFSQRVKDGLPVLNETEFDAYLDVLAQLAKELGADYQASRFKIKHDATGEQVITVYDPDGSSKPVNVTITKQLPYSMTKLAGQSSCIFSFGGSRGAIAPFAGFDAEYPDPNAPPKVKRFFTNYQLLGVGQYGLVRQVETLEGFNLALKSVVVANGLEQTFNPEARNDTFRRPISQRDVKNPRIEFIITRAYAKAKQQQVPMLWSEKDKERPNDKIFRKTPIKSSLLAGLAPGVSYAQLQRESFGKYSKSDPAFHNSSLRDDTTEDTLNLAGHILDEIAFMHEHHFIHNDIKPENFLVDGDTISFIDWETGGFEANVEDDDAFDLPDLKALMDKLGSGVDEKEELSTGLYVRRDKNGALFYGIKPKLSIGGEGKQCTLPYIPPEEISDDDRNKKLAKRDPFMDNWQATALIFGVGNFAGYGHHVKGRAVLDYIVPGILASDEGNPAGLQITGYDKFDEFFGCYPCDSIPAKIDSLKGYQSPVMYIPTNDREGEPLGLYRRLEEKYKQLKNEDPGDDPLVKEAKKELCVEIKTILDRVFKAVETGSGLTINELKTLEASSQSCLARAKRLNTSEFKDETQRRIMLKEILVELESKPEVSVNGDLAKIRDPRFTKMSNIELLCTLPTGDTEQKAAADIIRKANAEDLSNWMADTNPQLLQLAITNFQAPVAIALIQTLDKDVLRTLITEQGLLHFALSQGMTDVATALLAKYEHPTKFILQDEGMTSMRWGKNALLIAIQNNNTEQLTLLLSKLSSEKYKINSAIHDALLFTARLGRVDLLEMITTHFAWTTAALLEIKTPTDKKTIFHYLISQVKFNPNMPVSALTNDAFLKTPPYPILLAAAGGNFEMVDQLLDASPLDNIDDSGKNLLNYVLEKRHLKTLDRVIEKISTTPNLMISLLASPNPLNPLINFLKKEDTPTIETLHSTLSMLNAVCNRSSATEPQQLARVALILSNSAWIYKAAALGEEALRSLLRSDSLSPHCQFAMLTTLIDRAPSTDIKTILETFQKEVTPHKNAEITLVERITPQIIAENYRLRGDLKGLVEYLSNFGELEGKIKALKAGIQLNLQDLSDQKLELLNKQQESQRLAWQLDEVTERQVLLTEKMNIEKVGYQNALKSMKESDEEGKTQMETSHLASEAAIMKELQQVRDNGAVVGNALKAREEELKENQKFSRGIVKWLIRSIKEVKALQVDLGKSTATLNESESKTDGLAKELDELVGKLNEERIKNKELEFQFKQVAQRNEELLLSVGRFESLNHQLSDELTRLNQRVYELEENLENNVRELADQKLVLAREEQVSKRLTLELKEATAWHAILAKKIEIVNADYQIKLAKLGESDVEQRKALEVSSLDAKAAIEKELEDARVACGRVEESLYEVSHELEESKRNVAELAQDLRGSIQDNKNLKDQIEQQVLLSQVEKEKMSIALEASKELAQKAMKRVVELTRDLVEVQKVNQALESDIVTLTNDNRVLISQVSELDEAVVTLRREVGATKEALQVAQAATAASQLATVEVQKALEKAAVESRELSVKIDDEAARHASELRDLKGQHDAAVTALGAGNEKAEAALKANHVIAVQSLNQAHEQKCATLAASLQGSQEEVAKLRGVVQGLGEKLQASVARGEGLTNELSVLNQLHEELKARTVESDIKNTALLRTQGEEIAGLVAQSRSVESQLFESQQANQALESNIVNLSDRNRVLMSQVGELNAEVQSIGADSIEVILNSLRERLAKVNQLLNQKSAKLDQPDLEVRKDKHERILGNLMVRWKRLNQKIKPADTQLKNYNQLCSDITTAIGQLTHQMRANAANTSKSAERNIVTPPPIAPPIRPAKPATSNQAVQAVVSAPKDPSQAPTGEATVITSSSPSKPFSPNLPFYLFGEMDNRSNEIRFSRARHPLNKDQCLKLITEEGVSVCPCGGKEYSFSYVGGKPVATLSKMVGEEGKKDPLHQARIALTIINMIDNVLAKSGAALVNTPDPYVAAVARKYLDHLKDKGINISTSIIKLNGEVYKEIPAPDVVKPYVDAIEPQVSKCEESNEGNKDWEVEVKKDMKERNAFFKSAVAVIRIEHDPLTDQGSDKKFGM